ncbi:hypothetical protein MTCD1_00994 [Colwellia marinimaniae]|uniref:Transposase n=1 Tax=Colwellia marinimaniae TaxID=1513592 RepID=A0ABQ0MT36_9GAMM|nr:hypothetical protein MTCD1_00994 [Colwellia marinimaniae]
MKRPFKSNQRRKQLSRQHDNMTSRRQSYFNLVMNEFIESQGKNLLSK